jgi:SAM-dependent methyltransferase
MEKIEYKMALYPKFQAEGFAAQFAFPFALKVCIGEGLDIGYGKPEWKLPGAFGIDDGKQCTPDGAEGRSNVSAVTLRYNNYDYIFSSHCLEHLPDWVGVLNYWLSKIKPGGVLFLYLPHPLQIYWKPWNNRKHVNILHPQDLRAYFAQHDDIEYSLVTEQDLNHSFYAIAEKK